MWKSITEAIRSGYTDEEQRKLVMFISMNFLLAVVAGVMTAINLRTKEYELMAVTLAFTAICLFNALGTYYKWLKKETFITLFTIEAQVLLVYFVLSGIPAGFSVLWTLLVPAIALYVFGQKVGIRFSLLTLAMVIFFFWLPFGRSLLYYEYSEVFMLRFPFVYICLFLAAWYIDTIRMGVYRRLQQTEEKARYLYRHDALTGIYSRHAFYEELEEIFATPSEHGVSAVMFDVDDFKIFNDRYGHNAGDEILKKVARVITGNICEHCIACRWGGEEFLVMMQCSHDPELMARTILREAERTNIQWEDQPLHITLSAGIATTDVLDKARLSAFINCADKAMYGSKEAGKNRITSIRF